MDIEVTGKVTQLTHLYGGRNRHHVGPEYIVHYDFITAQGVLMHDTQMVSRRFFKTLAEGGELTILYHPQDPEVNWIWALSPFELSLGTPET